MTEEKTEGFKEIDAEMSQWLLDEDEWSDE